MMLPRAVLCLALVVGLAFALLVRPVAAQRFLVHTYAEAEGVPSSSVRSVVQDRQGRMWFATRVGIACFDGARWQSYGRRDGLVGSDQLHVMLGSAGRVWAVSTDPTPDLCYFDGRRWHPAGPPLSLDLGRSCASVVRCRSGDRFVLGSANGIAVSDGSAWQILQLPGGSAQVRSMEAVGERLLVSAESGVFVVDPESGTISRYQGVLEGDALVFHHDESNQRLWVVTADQVAWIENPLQPGARWRRLAIGLELPFEHSHSVAQCDHLGGLYFGDQARVFYFHPVTGLERLSRRNGLVSEGALSMLRDRENNLWITCPRGISKLVSRRFANYRREDGLLENEVTAIHRLPNGKLLLGHGGGLTVFDDSPRVIELGGDPAGSRVTELTAGPDGRVWVAGSGLGYGVFESGRVGWRHDIPICVWAILFDCDGTQWLGGQAGLFRQGADGPQRIEHPELLGVRRIYQSRDGSIYATTGDAGLFRWRAGRLKQWKHRSMLAASSVYCVLERPDGAIWVGSAAGLQRVAGDELVALSQPLVHRPIYFMVEAPDRAIWFGTDNGVIRWHQNSSEHFTVEHGLAGREVNRDALLFAADGDVWIGTDLGLSHYRRHLDELRRIPPSIEVTAVEAGGRSLSPTGDLEFDGSGGEVLVRILLAAFVDEKRVRVQTFLAGHDTEWSTPRLVPDREIRYAGLPPGEYQLRVRAIDVHGVVGAERTTGRWTVLRVWWLRPWAVTLAVLLASAVLILLVGFTIQRRYARQLKVQVRLRTAEVVRLQAERSKFERLESLGVLAGGIAHDFNNLLTGMLGNLSLLETEPALAEDLRELVVSSREAADRARCLTTQLLTFASGGAPVRKAVAIQSVIRDAIAAVPSGGKVQHELQLAADLWSVEIDVGQMRQVFDNLLSNAREAMPGGGTVTVRGQNLSAVPPSMPPGRYLSIEISDQGAGLTPQLVDRIFDPFFSTKEPGRGLGLASAHGIVDRHDGCLTVASVLGEGAQFRLCLPASDEQVEILDPTPTPAPNGVGRVLVVDDEAVVRRVLVRMLTRLGYTCQTARDGEEGIAIYRAAAASGDPVCVVIMDLTIRGGLGGLAATQRLRQLDPAVKVIVASGYSSDPVMAKYREHGFVGQLGKPFLPDELARVIAAAVAG